MHSCRTPVYRECRSPRFSNHFSLFLLAKRFFLLPWVFSSVVSLFLSPWGFFFCGESFSFSREVFSFSRESFSFSREVSSFVVSYLSWGCTQSVVHFYRLTSFVLSNKFLHHEFSAEDEKEKLLQVQSPWIITFKGEDVKEIYFKSIVPAVTYGVVVWRNCSYSIMDSLNPVQVRVVRVIHQDKSLEKLNWLPISYIYKRRLILRKHDILND